MSLGKPNHVVILEWLQSIAALDIGDILLRIENCKDLILCLHIEGDRVERIEKVRPISQQIAAITSSDKLRHSPLGIGAGNRDAGKALVLLLELLNHFVQIMTPIDAIYLETYPEENEE